MVVLLPSIIFFFFNDTATTEIYPLSLHDALPISLRLMKCTCGFPNAVWEAVVKSVHRVPMPITTSAPRASRDRKSTRLNSSHVRISYAVFCLKKKNANEWCDTQTTVHSSNVHLRA